MYMTYYIIISVILTNKWDMCILYQCSSKTIVLAADKKKKVFHSYQQH
jgi:hypothetical protein